MRYFLCKLRLLPVLLFCIVGMQATAATLSGMEWEAKPEVGRPWDEVKAAWGALAAELRAQPVAAAPAEEQEGKDESMVQGNLRWFARHQLADGSWSASGHSGACTLAGSKVAPDTALGAWGVGWPERDVLLTAGGVLVYLGAGYDHLTPNRFRPVVSTGVDYLVKRVGPESPPLVHHHTRALVTLALMEAFVMTADPRLREPCKRALDALLNTALRTAQGEKQVTVGWAATYGGREVDLQATLLGVMALKSALAADFDVSAHFDGLRQWYRGLLAECAAFLHGAGRADICLPQRATISRDRLYGEDSAAGLCLAAFLGLKAQEEPRIGPLAERVLGRMLPLTKIDPFQRYVATLGLFQAGEPWWNTMHLVQADDIIRKQIHSEDCLNGSWAAHPGLNANIGSSALTTTILSSVTLDVHYRYRP